MGQIPVKIMGAAQTGDYIVASNEIPGYGVAITPNEMTIEDFERAVGRAWEPAEGPGPKMVNTVVGVHNGNMINVMKNMQQQQKQNEARLCTIEDQIETLLQTTKNEK